MENKNQPAFPVPVAANDNGVFSSFDANGGESLAGLTKREYFAAMAMQGLLANPRTDVGSLEKVAEAALIHADDLLAELEK